MSHGLAASIRGSTESETFDLAGSTAATIETTIRDAFAEPFALSEMIRLTFVTGAGKLGRARYDDNAAKAVTATLRELGYEEDRGASAVMACSGTFKSQHDTGKNLYTVVVFPKVLDSVEGGMGGLNLGGGDAASAASASFLQEGSTEHKLAHTSMNVFPRMIESQCQTWSQKKGCVAAITDLKGMAESLDAKLMAGQQLTDSEQEFYDSVSLTSLEEKLACVRELMQKQVDAGNITADEQQQLLTQVSERLQTLAKEISEAETQGKTKRVESLKGAQEKAKARKEKLSSISPKPLPRLKNEEAIASLRRELTPLLAVEEGAKGRLLTLKESQAVSRKDEILAEIQELEQSSRGWFESDVSFEARIKASRDAYNSKKKQAAKKKPSSAASGNKSSALPSTTKWVTPGSRKQAAWSKPAKKKIPSGGGLFAAMMNESDSD